MYFPCTIPECQKLFNCKKALKEHERTHNQDRPFKCELCDQTFTQYSSLQKHARVHDKKKPYQCHHDDCTQAFSQVSNLIRHQRIHTGDKPYHCEYCDKKFASGSNLKQHLQIHDKQDTRNQFVCMFKQCGKNYLYQSSLKKHYLMSHNDAYELYLTTQNIETRGYHLKDNIQEGEEEELEQSIIFPEQAPVEALPKGHKVAQEERKLKISSNNQAEQKQPNKSNPLVDKQFSESQPQAIQYDMFKAHKQDKRQKEVHGNRLLAKRLVSSSLQLDLQDSNFKRVAKSGMGKQQQNTSSMPIIQSLSGMSSQQQKPSDQQQQQQNSNCFVNYHQYLFIQNQPPAIPPVNNSIDLRQPLQSGNLNKSLYSVNTANSSKSKEMPLNYLQQSSVQYSNPNSPFLAINNSQAAGYRHAQEKYYNSLQQQLSQYLPQSSSNMTGPSREKSLLDHNETASDFLPNPMAPYNSGPNNNINDINLQQQSPFFKSTFHAMNQLQNSTANPEARQQPHNSNLSFNCLSPSSLKKLPVKVLSQNGREPTNLIQEQQQNFSYPSAFKKTASFRGSDNFEISSPIDLRVNKFDDQKQLRQQLSHQNILKSLNPSPLTIHSQNNRSQTNQVSSKLQLTQPSQLNDIMVTPFNGGKVESSIMMHNMNNDIEDIHKKSSSGFQKVNSQPSSAFLSVKQRPNFSSNSSPKSGNSLDGNANPFLSIMSKGVGSRQQSLFKKQPTVGVKQNYGPTAFSPLQEDVIENQGDVSAMLRKSYFGGSPNEKRSSAQQNDSNSYSNNPVNSSSNNLLNN